MEQPKRMPADQPVRDRFLTELDRNAVVEAGAGTGKTTLLVDRIVAQVTGGRVPDGQGRRQDHPPRELVPVTALVAMTFTELAAAELGERLRDRLVAAADFAREEGDTQLLGHLERAVLELPSAAISTIHGFSSRVLREHALAAGLDPAFEVLEAAGSRRLIQEVFDLWFEEVSRGPAVRATLSHGISLERIEACARDLMDLGPAALDAPALEAGAGIRDGGARELFEVLQTWLAERSDWLDDGFVPPEDGYASILERAEGLLASHVGLLEDEPSDEDYVAFELELMQERWKNPKKGRVYHGQWEKAVKDLGGPSGAEFKARGELYVQAIADLRAAIARQLLAGLEPVLLSFRQHYQEEKLRRSVLDFDDLLALVEELVRTQPEVRLQLLERYRTIYVDEFQDTNPVQARLVFFLAGGPESCVEEDWSQVPPEPGRLVMVGDPKQSIYRFRQADVEIYRDCCDLALAADPGAGYAITTNFRTDGPLVAWVNHRFEDGAAKMAAPKHGNYQADFVPLVAHHLEEGAESPVLVLRQPEQERARGADANRPAEGRALAAWLRSTFLDDSGQPQKACLVPGGPELALDDVAVLARTDKVLQAYASALSEAGLPYVREGGGKLFQREEVCTAMTVLLAVVEPGRQPAVVGALRSVWFGLSDDQLLEHRLAGGGFDPLESASVSGVGSEPVAAALARLGSWSRRVASAPLEVLAEVLRDPELSYLLSLRPGGVQAPMNLLRLECFLRDALSELGLAGAVRSAADLSKGGSDEKGARLALPGAVRLLTIHGSKGLEFPVVVLAGIDGQPNNSPDSSAWLTDDGLVWRLSASVALPSYDERKDWDKPRAAAEKLRHFYVALTRAKHHLVLPLFGAANASGTPLMGVVGKGVLGGLLGKDFAEPGEDPALFEVEPVALLPRPSVAVDPGLAEHLGPDAPAASAPARLAEQLAQRGKQPPESLAPSLFAAGDEPAAEVAPELGTDPGVDVDGARARTIGTLTHLCLELGLERDAAHRRAQLAGLDAADATFVADCVAAAAGFDSTERARTAARVHDEPPVHWRTRRSDGTELHMRGYIDRLIEFEDGSVEVLDYKTDRIDPADGAALAERAAHHRLQLGLYGGARAAAGLTGARLTGASLPAGVEVVFHLDDAVRAEVQAALEAAPRHQAGSPG
ncbi:MAG: UvrD-helicase domain-containing protein [Planctomycetota bacterium]|nr:UvrD-helicase domain-containing protein [Planctomycetota bacterium]